MTRAIERRLVNGVWVTGDFEEVGNGGSQPIVSGVGSPVGTVTPTAGKPVYVDTENGALYLASGLTDLDWIAVGPVNGNIGEVTGIVSSGRTLYLLTGDRDAVGAREAYFGDAYSWWNGHSQGLYWDAGPGEGFEVLRVVTGATGQHAGTLQDGDGNMNVPGTIAAAGGYVNAADLDMDGHGITDLRDPAADQEAATKKYVDDNVLGGTLPFDLTDAGGDAGPRALEVVRQDDSKAVIFTTRDDGDGDEFGTIGLLPLNNIAAVKVRLPAGYVADVIDVYDSDDNLLFQVGPTGSLRVKPGASAMLEVVEDAIGFFGHAVAGRPEVPAVPSAQNIADALVQLGLITQAP